MRKSFTRLFGFLLLNVMMLFSFGLYAQEQQSTVELKAPVVDKCYNQLNSYVAPVTVRDFIAMKSFDLTLKYDQTEFGVTSVTNVNSALGGTLTTTVDAVTGKIRVQWSSATAVTIGDNSEVKLFDVNFNILNFPNNSGDNLFDSSLTWDSATKFYYGENFTGSYQVSTTAFTNGSLNVPVNYNAIQYTVTPASCDGGQATIQITNPVGAGLYYYFNGSTTSSTVPTATAQAPSNNTVRIVDATGCYSHEFQIPVTAPTPLAFTAEAEDAKCYGGNGEIQFNISGGVGPYTYYVVPVQDMNYFANTLMLSGKNAPALSVFKYTNFQVLKPAGQYYVNVDGANGCNNLNMGWWGTPLANPSWQVVTINNVSAPISFATTVTDVECNGASDGTIAVSAVSGGTTSPTGSYSVSINGTNWFPISTTTSTYTFSNLVAGTYTVTVKDYNGCTKAVAVPVTQPDAIKFTLAYQDATCAGGATGSVTITSVEGGTAPYTYAVVLTTATSWGTATSTENMTTGLSANYYKVRVWDANGCYKDFANQDGSGNILPIQAPGELAFTTNTGSGSEVACNGGSFTLTVTATGGVAPYVYSFDGGTTTTTSSSYFMSGLTTDTTVSVQVTDANGCPKNQLVTVNVPLLLTAELGVLASVGESNTYYLPPTCPDGNDGRVRILAQGGTSPYMYSTDNVIWFANPVLAVPEGTTTITVKDAKGCTAETSVTVSELIASTVTATVNEINCHGAKDGLIEVETTWQDDRTIQYFVASSAAAVYSTGTVFNPATIDGEPNTETPTTFYAGTYYIGARDEYGCVAPVISVVIKEKAALQMTAAVTPATCFGLFDGTLTINTTGGYGEPSYAIVNNALAISNLEDDDFLPLATWSATTTIGKQVVQVQRGTYYVVLRDNCVDDNSVFAGPFIVDGYKAITFDNTKLVKTNITCNNANDGTITLPLAHVKGGKPEFDGVSLYTFTLVKPVGGTVTNTTGVFTGLAGGSYTVTITDSANCSAQTISNIVIVNPSKPAFASVAVKHFSCVGSNNGEIAVTATGGTGGYWLAVNASVNKTGNDIKASDWLPFGTSTATTSKTYVATEPGIYYLYLRDANGCLGSTVSVTVLEPAALTLSATVTDVDCATNNSGSVVLVAGGGYSPTVTQTYQFVVKKGSTTVGTNATGSFTGLLAGAYTAEVTATNGSYTTGIYTYPTVNCKSTISFTVRQPDAYAYQAYTEPVKCKGGSDGSLTVTVLAGKAATVTTTGSEYYVQITTTATPTLTATDWKRTTNQTYKFTGLSHAHYSVWISNANTINGTVPSVYSQGACLLPVGTETVTDAVYHTVQSWEVNEPDAALTAAVTWNKDVTCYGGNDGKFTVTAAGGVAPYKYAAKKSVLPAHVFAPAPGSSEWQSSNVFDQATAATWIIWVIDANGCIVGGEGNGTPQDQWRVQVRQPNAVNYSATRTNATCFGANDGKITFTPNVSAGAPYTYIITGKDYTGADVSITGTTTSTTLSSYTISNIPANRTAGSTATNKYTITISDKNGCSTPTTVDNVIEQYKELKVDIVKADGAFMCPGDNNGTIEAVATGGSGTYAYRLWRDGAPFTAWVTIPSFLVEVGHTWAVQVSDKRGNMTTDPLTGCLATDTEVINAPVGVTAILKETTCYGDPKASVVVSATGEAGRTFSVRYRINTGSYGSWLPLNASNELAIANLEFANVTETENFYYFQIKDNMGCMTEEIKKPFVPTQHPLQVTLTQTDLNAAVAITGGISPYTYQIGDAVKVTLPVANNEFQVVNLKAGQTTVTVWDAHGCPVAKSVTVAPLSVTAEPATGNNQTNTFNVALTFNRDVTGVASATTVTGGTATVTGSGKAYTVAVKADDLAQVVIALGNTIADAATNTLTATSFTYTVGDHVAPTVVVTPPATPVAKVFTVGLAFSEAVSGVEAGITVTGGSATVTGSGATYTLTVTAPEQTKVTITLTDAIKDLSTNANKLVAKTVEYTTGDFTAPTWVSNVPANATTINDNHPKPLSFTLSEAVKLSTAGGSLKITKVGATTASVTVPLTSAMINGSVVSVTYTSGLDKNTDYFVTVDADALEDLAGNKFAGITASNTWTFKTGANFATPVDVVNGSLKVYPNPFVDYVNVVTTSEMSKVVVTNIAGQVVKEVVNPSNTIQLDGLRSGVYFISIYDRDAVIGTAKIVKR